MAIYIEKDGVIAVIDSFVGKALIAELTGPPEQGGIPNPMKRLVLRGLDGSSGFASESSALSIAEANGWTEYSVQAAPDTPTVTPTTLVLGDDITVTITADGDVKVYRNGAFYTTLVDQADGDITYEAPEVGSYRFSLVVNGLESAQSGDVLVTSEAVDVESGILVPDVYYGVGDVKNYAVTSNDGGIITVVMKIVQSGTNGGVITDTTSTDSGLLTAFNTWGDNHAYGHDVRYSINKTGWLESSPGTYLTSLNNYDLTALAGEVVEIIKGVGFAANPSGDDVPTKTMRTVIQIGA